MTTKPVPVAAVDVPSIVAAFWSATERWGNRPALRSHQNGEEGDRPWKILTWADYGEAVEEVMGGLAALGVTRGDRVAVLTDNRPEWHIADVATMSLGAISVPIYQTSPASQVSYVLGHSGAAVVVVDSHEQAAKVLQVRGELPELRRLVIVDCADAGPDAPFTMTWARLREMGREHIGSHPTLRDDAVAAVQPADVATLVYTSGTTGPPKGAMLTHASIAFTLRSLTTVVPIGPDDRFLSFLPLSHIAERMVSHFGQIGSGGETWFARSLTTVPDDLLACRPTIFFAVPRVWEKFREKITEHMTHVHGLQGALAHEYMRLAEVVAAHRTGTGHASFTTLMEYDVLDKVVGAKIRSSLGMDKVRILSSGAAPISPDLLRWFHGIGLPVGEVYGQTEDCGPATVNPPDDIRIGTVGPPIPGLELRIAADGEILVRGGSVCAGYWRNPQATAELIEPDGWMHTGDVGTLDDSGYVTITDRKKDLIITAAGQNVAPQQIETRLREEPLIAQPVVIGDGRKYLTALITLDSTELSTWAHHHHKLFDPEQLARDPEVRDAVARAIERVNAEFARVEGIKRFRVLPHEFTVAAGQLTPTLKVRRRSVVEQHAALIEEMYADQIDLTDGSAGIGEVRAREGMGS